MPTQSWLQMVFFRVHTSHSILNFEAPDFRSGHRSHFLRWSLDLREVSHLSILCKCCEDRTLRFGFVQTPYHPIITVLSDSSCTYELDAGSWGRNLNEAWNAVGLLGLDTGWVSCVRRTCLRGIRLQQKRWLQNLLHRSFSGLESRPKMPRQIPRAIDRASTGQIRHSKSC